MPKRTVSKAGPRGGSLPPTRRPWHAPEFFMIAVGSTAKSGSNQADGPGNQHS